MTKNKIKAPFMFAELNHYLFIRSIAIIARISFASRKWEPVDANKYRKKRRLSELN